MPPRVASSVLVGALTRIAQGEGGFAAVLAKGDPDSGAILIVVNERGETRAILERLLQPDGSYRWQESGDRSGINQEELKKFLDGRRKFDADLWIIELDVPSAERLIAQTGLLD